MAMKMAAPRVLQSRRLFSSFPFSLPPSPASSQAPPPADPSPNLFVSAQVVTDRDHGYSKGFGFVRYASVEEAAEGVKGMDGKFLDGWVIFAEYARPRAPRPPPHNMGSPPSFPRY